MPWWKFISNRFLTGVENTVFGLHLSEYHTGYRAYRREVLETVNFALNADKFIFDQEIMAQIVEAGLPHRRGAGADALLRRGVVGQLPGQHALRPRHPLAGGALRAAPPRHRGRSASSRACAGATGSCPEPQTDAMAVRRTTSQLRADRVTDRRTVRGRAGEPRGGRSARAVRCCSRCGCRFRCCCCCSTSRSISGSGTFPS